jgi:hypothetical protein
MSVYYADDTLLAEHESEFTLDHPIIAWDNYARTGFIYATSSAVGYPYTNLLNPATHLHWKAATNDPLEVNFYPLTAEDIDYVAIARHNLGSEGISVELGYYDGNSPSTFIVLISERLLAGDGPALFRFTAQPIDTLVMRLGSGSAPADIAVASFGKLLVLPRKLYQGMTPPPFARTSKATNGRSEAGNFLGRITTQAFKQAKVPLQLLDQTYYREYIDEFVQECGDLPFFFAWRPQTYPDEVVYAIMTNNPQPFNEAPHGLASMTLEMSAVE